KVVDSILRCGANPNLACSNRKTPLHRAVSCQATDCVTSLLLAGADPNARDRNGEMPLHRGPMYRGNPSYIPVLVKFGAQVNAKNSWGDSPLCFAATADNPEAATELLKQGADIEHRGYM